MPFFINPKTDVYVSAELAAAIEKVTAPDYGAMWASAISPMFGPTVPADRLYALAMGTPAPPEVVIAQPEDTALMTLRALCSFAGAGVLHVDGRYIHAHALFDSLPGVEKETHWLNTVLSQWSALRRGHASTYATNSTMSKSFGPVAGLTPSTLAQRAAAVIEYGLSLPKSARDPEDPTKGTPARQQLAAHIKYTAAQYPGLTVGQIQSRLHSERGPVRNETVDSLPERIALVSSLWPL